MPIFSLLIFLPLILLPWCLCGARLMRRFGAGEAARFCGCGPILFFLAAELFVGFSMASGMAAGICAAAAGAALFAALWFLAGRFGFKGVIFPQLLLFVLLLAWIRTKSGSAEPETCATTQLVFVQLTVFYEAYFLLCVFLSWIAEKAVTRFRKNRAPAEENSPDAEKPDLSR